MKFFVTVLSVLFFGCGPVLGMVIDNDIVGAAKTFDSDVVVNSGVTINAEYIKVADSMRIDNFGVINSDVYLCDRCELRITNYGVVNSGFVLGDGAKIIQYVDANDSMKRIDFNVDYDVVLESSDVMNFDEVIDFSNGANTLFVRNTVLNLDELPNDVGHSVHFGTGVVINIGDLDVVGNVLVLDNVVTDNGLRFYGAGDNPMYVNRGYVHDGGLYIERVRETDYDKVLGGKVGAYINSLRHDSAAAELMGMLDSATDMDGIHKIIGKTVRMNPNLLKNKIETLHMADILNMDIENYGAGLSLFGAGDADMMVVGIGAGYKHTYNNNLKFGVDLRVGKMLYASDIDEFDANLYMGTAMAEYMPIEDLFVRAGMGIVRSDFDIGTVFYDNRVFDNPTSVSGYADIDVGYKFNLNKSVYVAPIVGTNAHFYEIENYAVSDVFLHAGGDVGYLFESNSVKYKYLIRGYVNNDGVPSVMGRVGFWSEMDGIGGHLQFGGIHMYDMTSYNFTINAQMAF